MNTREGTTNDEVHLDTLPRISRDTNINTNNYSSPTINTNNNSGGNTATSTFGIGGGGRGGGNNTASNVQPITGSASAQRYAVGGQQRDLSSSITLDEEEEEEEVNNAPIGEGQFANLAIAASSTALQHPADVSFGGAVSNAPAQNPYDLDIELMHTPSRDSEHRPVLLGSQGNHSTNSTARQNVARSPNPLLSSSSPHHRRETGQPEQMDPSSAVLTTDNSTNHNINISNNTNSPAAANAGRLLAEGGGGAAEYTPNNDGSRVLLQNPRQSVAPANTTTPEQQQAQQQQAAMVDERRRIAVQAAERAIAEGATPAAAVAAGVAAAAALSGDGGNSNTGGAGVIPSGAGSPVDPQAAGRERRPRVPNSEIALRAHVSYAAPLKVRQAFLLDSQWMTDGCDRLACFKPKHLFMNRCMIVNNCQKFYDDEEDCCRCMAVERPGLLFAALCVLDILTIGAPCGCFYHGCGTAAFGCWSRWMVRRKYRIEGFGWSDFLMYLCCVSCVSAQMEFETSHNMMLGYGGLNMRGPAGDVEMR